MDKQRIRTLTLQVLQKNPQTHVHMIENEIRQLTEEYDRHDTLMLQEVVWELLVQGVLAPGKNSLNMNLPFVHVTDYGARCLDDGSVRAHDPEGYATHVAAIVGDRAPDTIVEGAREAQLCFLAGRHASALVMLSRAAEALIGWLADSLSLPADQELAAITEETASRKLPPALEQRRTTVLTELGALLDLCHATWDANHHPRARNRDELVFMSLFDKIIQHGLSNLKL